MEAELDHYSEKQIEVEVVVPNFSKTENYANGKATQLRKRPANDAEFVTLFGIKFYPNGNTPENEGYVSTMFQPNPRMASRGGQYYLFHCTVSLVDSNENLRFGQSFGMDFDCDAVPEDLKYSIGLERFIKREVLIASSEEFLPGDALTLRCDVAYVLSSVQEEQMTEAFFQQNEFRNVAKDESWFFHSNTEGGVIGQWERLEDESRFVHSKKESLWGKNYSRWRMVGNETWLANAKTEDDVIGHWLILRNPDSPLCTRLQAKSGYFKCLFRMPSKEMVEGLMAIDKNEYEAFFNLVCYIRFETLKHIESVEEYCDLYILADKYEVLDLKEICSTFLEQHMTNESAAGTLAIADLCYDVGLRKLALGHVLLNWKEVCRTIGWRTMRNKRPDLETEVKKLLRNMEDSNLDGNKPDEKYKNHAVDFDFYR